MKGKIIVEKVILTDEQNELDCRLAAYHKNATEGSPWKVVKERIFAHKGRSKRNCKR